MGKRIISQARGKGSLTYKVRKKSFRYKVSYPMHEGEAEVLKIINSQAHSAPLIKAKIENEVFYNVALNGIIEGQKITIGGEDSLKGNVLTLGSIPVGTQVFNIERSPGDGGKMIRTSGSSAVVNKRYDHGKIGVLMPNKKEIKLDENCRATIGVIAGDGRKQKAIIKAGRKYYKMKARGKLYPRVSAKAVNAVDHPFGSGRGGKGIRSKSSKRDAPPGRKVGHLRPRSTGRKKR